MAKIPDLPEKERPRERLARLGASALNDAELLAIFLRVGVQGSSAIELGRKLIKKYGSLGALGGLSVEELAREHGLGPAKAAQLIAAFELGIRCASEKMTRQPMNSAAFIYETMAPRLAHEREEHVIVLLLDVKLHVTRTLEVAKGKANSVAISPRDVMHHILVNRAPSFVLIHNHPSGDPLPSSNDDLLTTQIKKAADLMGIRFVDHLIIGRHSDKRTKPYFSYAENQGW